MNADQLAQARRALDSLRAAEGAATRGPWGGEESASGGREHWYEVAPLGAGGAPDWTRQAAGFVSEDGPFVVALRNAAPALLDLADAVVRLAGRGGDWPWWANFSDYARATLCVGCAGKGYTWREVVHADGCEAMAIDAALARLAGDA